MNEFVYIDAIGRLRIDKVLFESYYPILFTCANDSNDLFICVCCQANSKGKKWLLTKTTPQIIIDMLSDRITLREAFVKFPQIQYTILANDEAKNIIEKNLEDWDFDNSQYLPDKGEYMEVEDGEFEEEISYYEKALEDRYENPDVKKKYNISTDEIEEMEKFEDNKELNPKVKISTRLVIDSNTYKKIYKKTIPIHIGDDRDIHQVFDTTGKVKNAMPYAA